MVESEKSYTDTTLTNKLKEYSEKVSRLVLPTFILFAMLAVAALTTEINITTTTLEVPVWVCVGFYCTTHVCLSLHFVSIGEHSAKIVYHGYSLSPYTARYIRNVIDAETESLKTTLGMVTVFTFCIIILALIDGRVMSMVQNACSAVVAFFMLMAGVRNVVYCSGSKVAVTE